MCEYSVHYILSQVHTQFYFIYCSNLNNRYNKSYPILYMKCVHYSIHWSQYLLLISVIYTALIMSLDNHSVTNLLYLLSSVLCGTIFYVHVSLHVMLYIVR